MIIEHHTGGVQAAVCQQLWENLQCKFSVGFLYA